MEQHSGRCRARCPLGIHHHHPSAHSLPGMRYSSDCVPARMIEQTADTRPVRSCTAEAAGGEAKLRRAAASGSVAAESPLRRSGGPQHDSYFAIDMKRRSSAASNTTAGHLAVTCRSGHQQTNHHIPRAPRQRRGKAGALVCSKGTNKAPAASAAPARLPPSSKDVKGVFLDRLTWLEERILQISLDLDKKGGCSATSSTNGSVEAAENSRRWNLQPSAVGLLSSSEMNAQDAVLISSRRLIEGPGAHGHTRNSNTAAEMVKDSQVRVGTKNAHKDGKRMTRTPATRLYKRWFPITC